MSELQQQLDFLKTVFPQSTTRIIDGGKGRESFLFEPTKAAEISVADLYAIAQDGLQDLLQLDSRFRPFQDTLFSQRSVNENREMQSRQFNKDLDERLGSFLRLLSPYFLMRAAHKTLEFLIRRYKIHIYNVNDVMACMLPYHDTLHFARMVQLLHIERNLWHFLAPIQRTGASLQRDVLVMRCARDLAILEFITESTRRMMHEEINHTSYTSFYTAIMLDFIDQHKMDDVTVKRILPFVFHLIQAENRDFKASGFMVLTQLSSNIKLTESVLDSLMKAIVKDTNDYNSEEPLLALVFLFQSQSLDTMRFDVFEKLIHLRYFDRQLQQIAQRYDIANFMRAFMKTLVEHSLATGDTSLLTQYLEMQDDVLRLHTHIPFVTRQLFHHYLEFREQIGEVVPKVLDIIEKRFGPEMDRGLYLCLDDMDEKDEDLVLQFLHMGFKGSKHAFVEELNGTLFLSLQHPEASIRLLAAKRLEKMLNDLTAYKNGGVGDDLDEQHEKTRSFIRDSFVQLLDDTDSKVIRQVLSIKDLVKIVDITTLLEKLTALMKKELMSTSDKQRKRVKNLVIPALHTLLREEVISQDPKRISAFVVPLVLELLSSHPALTKNVKRDLLNRIEHPLLHELVFDDNIQKDQDLISHFAERMARNINREPDTLLFECNTMIRKNVGARIILLSLLKVFQFSNDANVRLKIASGIFEIARDALRNFQLDQSVISSSKKKKENKYDDASSEELMILSIATSLHELAKDYHPINTMHSWSIQTEATDHMEDVGQYDSTGKEQSYTALLTDIFVCTLSNPNAFDNPDSVTIVKSILSDHLEVNAIPFMSQFWSSKIGAVNTLVTERCLSMTAALIVNSTQDVVDLQHILPSLFVALFSENYATRYTAMNCVRALGVAIGKSKTTTDASDQDIHGTKLTRNAFHNLITRVEEQKNKFLTNDMYLVDFIVREAQTITGLVRFILNHATAKHASPHTQFVLLRSVEKVATKEKLVICLPLLQSLLGKAQHCISTQDTQKKKKKKSKQKQSHQQSALTLEEYQLLSILIRDCFVVEAIELLNDTNTKQYWNVFTECVAFHKSILYHGETAMKQIGDGSSVATLSHQQHLHTFVPCVSVISNIGNRMFSELNKDHQKQLFSLLCDVVKSNMGNGLVTGVVHDVCRILAMPASIIIDVIQEAGSILQPSKSNLSHITNVLEIVVIMEEIIDRDLLAKEMFNLLSIFIDWNYDISSTAVDYAMNLLFIIIFSIAQRMAEAVLYSETGQKQKEYSARARDIFDMDIIVQCLQHSSQIRNQSISLIGMLTPLLPEQVLMHVISLLQIVQNTLQNDENTLSFEVVERTILQIVPAAAAEGTLDTVTIIEVLINCFDHIPMERRLPLFSTIIKSISRNKLHVVVFMLLQQHSKSQDAALFDFACDLLLYFKTLKQLKCVGRLVEFARLHLFPLKQRSTPVELDLPFDASSMTPEECTDLSLCILRLARSTIENTEFLHELISLEETGNKTSSQKVMLAIAQTLVSLWCTFKHKVKNVALEQICHSVSSSVQQLLDTRHFVALSKRLLASNDSYMRLKALDIFNMKMSNPAEKWMINEEEQRTLMSLLSVFGEIVSSKAESYQMVQCAVASIEQVARRFGGEHAKTIASLLPVVCAHLNDDSNLNVVASSALCVATINAEVGTMAVPHIPHIFKSLIHALRDMSLRYGDSVDKEHRTFRLALMYALDLNVRSQIRYISPYISDIVHILLHDQVVVSTSAALQQKGSDILNYLVDHVEPRLLMSPVLQSHSSALLNGQQSVIRLLSLVKDILSSLDAETASNFHVQYLQFFLALFDTRRLHREKVDDIDDVEHHILQAFSSYVLKLNESLFKPVLLKLVEWSRTPRKLLALDSVEEASNNGNISSLASTFVRWGDGTNKRELPHVDRLLIFYKLINSIADSLKSIFTEFWHFLLDPALDDLKRFNLKGKSSLIEQANMNVQADDSDDDDEEEEEEVNGEGNDGITSGKKRSRRDVFGDESDDDDEEEDNEDSSNILSTMDTEVDVIVSIISALDKLFSYDRDEFMSSRSVFEKIHMPLIDQVDNVTMGTLEQYMQRIDVLAPAMGKLAVAIPHHFWKPLQFAVLQKTQSDDPHIKISTLCILQEFYEHAGHEFIITLPEMIPYVAEMLDNDDDRVVDRVRILVEKVESVTGENIRQHLH